MCSDIDFFLIVSGSILGHFIYNFFLYVINKIIPFLNERRI